jgi:hypothetical protein
MPVSMKFTSSLGVYQFDTEEMPLIGRRVEYQRGQDQGYGNRRINCDLTGFFDRKNHQEIVAAYKELLDVIKANDAQFEYKVEDVTIINSRVYMDNFADPADWKEFQGDYAISFHYFEQPDFTVSDLGILATYTPTVGPAYVFVQTPYWQSGIKKNRAGFRAPAKTPAGVDLASEVTITLSGQLTADTHANMKNKIEELKTSFASDGVLNYGDWSNAVRVEDLQIPSVFPRDYCNFVIVLKYDSPGVIECQSRRSFSRIHGFPQIEEFPWCGTRRIRVFGPSGQYVNYFIRIRALDIATARTQLANEAANLIVAGGVEMEGGKEDWDDTDPSVSLSCTKFYNTPLLANLNNS